MKRFVLIFMILLSFANVFCKEWKYSYDEKIKIAEQKYHSDKVVMDKDLYDYAVVLWKKYFTEYYNKYGIPFIACYDSEEQEDPEGTAYHMPIRDADGNYMFSVIAIIDKLHKNSYNAKDSAVRAVENKDYDNVYINHLLTHEMCHTIVSMEWTAEQEKLHPSHYNSVFLREANRLQMDYDLDVYVY